MRKIYVFSTVLLIFLSAAGCRGRQAAFVPGGEVYVPRYASGFTIYGAGAGSSAIRITDPWQGAQGVEQWVFVASGGEAPPPGFTGTVVGAPARRIVCMSSSYVAFLAELGEDGRVAGVSGADFITNPRIRERRAAGDVAEVGYETNLDFEAIAALRPDLLLIFGVSDGGSQAAAKYREMGVPYVYIGDYLEEDPLGKAEWIVAVAELCGLRERGERVFAAIEQAYERTRRELSGIAERPRVMLNAPYRDTWYVPGDLNYMARLVEDAGGDYVCRGVASRDSRPIGVEEAYVYMQNAGYWINTNQYSTLAALLSDNPRFAATPPVVEGNVFNNNLRTTPAGGSDFWESGAVRPDRVLSDLARILHPGAFPGDTVLYYYRRLQ